MQCKFNHFRKKPDSKTGYSLEEGEPIFSNSVYLIEPRYIHKRSPAFSLVDSKGKHVTGLFPACGGAFTGDFKKQGLIAFIREQGLDLFLTDSSPVSTKASLCNGELTNDLFKAREASKIA